MAAFDNSPHPRPRPLTEHVVGIFVTRGSVLPVTYLDRVARHAGQHRAVPRARPRLRGVRRRVRDAEARAPRSPRYTAAAEHLAKRLPEHRRPGVRRRRDDAGGDRRARRSARRRWPWRCSRSPWRSPRCSSSARSRAGRCWPRPETTARSAALGMTRRQLFAASLAETSRRHGRRRPRRGRDRGRRLPADPDRPGPACRTRSRRQRERRPARRRRGRDRGAARRPRRRDRVAAGAARARPHRTPRNRRRAARGSPSGWHGRRAVAAVTGVRFALDPGTGRASVPVRSAMLGLAVAVAAVAGAGTFGANLLRLVDTPSLYGQDWNIALEGQFGAVTPKQFTQITGHVPGITDVTYGVHGTVTIGKTVIPAIGLAPGTGPVTSSTVLDGRPPATGGEIALGASVLRQLGLRVGQTVSGQHAGGLPPDADHRQRRLPLLRPGQLHAHRRGRGRRDHRGRARAARERRHRRRRRTTSRWSASRPGRPGRRTSRRSSARGVRSAPASSRTRAWSPTSARTR